MAVETKNKEFKKTKLPSIGDIVPTSGFPLWGAGMPIGIYFIRSIDTCVKAPATLSRKRNGR